MITWIIIGLAVILGFVFIGLYNGLVTRKTRVDESWSDIDVQLKRRYDLIPNLVEAVKGYAKQEQEIFIKVTEARNNAMSASNLNDKAKAENVLTDTLKSLFAVAENYPTLRSSENFQKLQDELTDTENKIEAARRFFNGNVREYNISIQTFPGNIVAGMFDFGKRDFFESVDQDVNEPPKVTF